MLGGPGLTAYVGLLDVAGLREGDVVWVSAAAGAVGSLASQIAKLKGHRVIGSAGSEAKVALLRDEYGLDAAFSHRAGPVADLLREAAPDGIDVYFDNVGGAHLEAALGALRRWGRVALCGAVSEYEDAGPRTGVRNLFQAVANDLTLRGFRGSSYIDRRPAFELEVGALAARGPDPGEPDRGRGPRARARRDRRPAVGPDDRQGARACGMSLTPLLVAGTLRSLQFRMAGGA